MKFIENDLKFKSPFCAVIGGQSGSGKTTLLLKLIKFNKDLIEPEPKNIIYCYGQYSGAINHLQKLGVRIHAGIPTEELLDSLQRPLLLILDDLMIQLNNKRDLLTNLFTRKSHHSNICIIFVVQNMFERNMKIVRDNSHYIFLLNSPAAQLQVRSLGSQLFPSNLKYFIDAYNQAVINKKFGYLLLDLHPASNASIRLRSNLFKEDSEYQNIYLPN
jgi:energy-coupling factor transporter ATP-binding protein EcfA2